MEWTFLIFEWRRPQHFRFPREESLPNGGIRSAKMKKMFSAGSRQQNVSIEKCFRQVTEQNVAKFIENKMQLKLSFYNT